MESNSLWKICTVRELLSHWVEIKPKSLWWVEIIRNKKCISSVHGLVHPACNVIWWGVVGVLFTLSEGNLRLQLRPENAIPHFFVLICLLPSKSRILFIFWWMYMDITIGACHCRLPEHSKIGYVVILYKYTHSWKRNSVESLRETYSLQLSCIHIWGSRNCIQRACGCAHWRCTRSPVLNRRWSH